MTEEQPDLQLMQKRIEALFDLVDNLMIALKKADPEIAKQLIINTRLNDFYLIRRGAK